MGKISNDLEKLNFKTFEKTGDLYCLFYELGNIILKPDGLLGYITSNKWLRANYGKSLRNYLLEETQPLELLDLGSGIFESATVDSNILIFQKSFENGKNFRALNISKVQNFNDFLEFEKNKVEINPTKNSVWSISAKNEQILKIKFDNCGVILNDWNVKINRGILTGLTEAFIIDEEKKSELISQDFKNNEVIVPVLRGRDVNRYDAQFANFYLINIHNGYSSTPKIEIDDYPTIKEHLEKYEPQLSKRFDKGITPYNLRNCAYIEAFKEPKIIWKEMSKETPFVIDKKGFFTNDTITFITGENLEYLLLLLNSKLCFYIYSKYYSGGGLGSLGIRFKKEFLSNLPLKQLSFENQQPFIHKADLMMSLNQELQTKSQKFQRTIQRKFDLEDLPKKLQDWYNLSYSEFIKELAKKKIKLSLPNEAEWEDYFTQESKKALDLKAQIDATDKVIDKMVYELYGLSEEEIEIVENC
jgi:hypothetical protein